MFFLRFYFFVIAALISFSIEAKLISPWDINNHVNYSKENSLWVGCPEIPQVSPDLTIKYGIYKSGTFGSIRDEDKVRRNHIETSSIFKSASSISKIADIFLSTRDKNIAICGTNLLLKLAEDNSLVGNIDGFQAHFTQSWILSSISLSWLKLRTEKTIPNDKKIIIEKWISKMSFQTLTFFNKWKTENPKVTNMYYWSGLAIISSGIVLNNDYYFNWGINNFKLGAKEVTSEGYLPNEIKRAGAARGYHLFSLAALVTIAELAASNNIDLYHYNSSAIIRLIKFSLNSVRDPREIEKLSNSRQHKISSLTASVGWLLPYMQRFPSEKYEDILLSHPNIDYFYTGGRPPPAVNLNLTNLNIKVLK